MARYIDAEKAEKSVFWDEDAIMAIRDIPNDYAVDVVRCKDCKFYRVNICWYWSGDPYEAASPEENDFCSYGERREDGETISQSKQG